MSAATQVWIDRLLASPSRQALQWTAGFAERRHAVLSENVANIDTPGYQTRIVDPKAFQAALRDAYAAADSETAGTLRLRGNRQISTDARGQLVVQPALEPAENVLFHDGTNARLEDLITQVNENALTYNFAISRLKSSFDTLQSAIRGRNT